MGAVRIMWLRQVKKYWRSKARMIGSLGQPLLFLLALGFGLGHIFEQAGGGNYIYFLTPGVIAMGILFTAMFAGIEVIWDRQFGFLKETLVAPVARWKIMLGRTLGGATIACIQGIIVLLISMAVGFRPASVLGFIYSLFFMFLIALLFTAFGTAIASRLTDMQAFPLIMNFLIMPIFFLSGDLFPLEGLPKIVSIITKLNPLTYGIDGLRWALTGVSHFNIFIDFTVIFYVTILIGLFGSYMFSKIEV